MEAGAQRLAVAAVEEGMLRLSAELIGKLYVLPLFDTVIDYLSFYIGILLRNNGIIPKEADVLVLGLSAPGTEKALLEHNLIPTLADVHSLARFVDAHHQLGLNKPLRYHLKVDTGMGRIGTLPEDIPNFIEFVKNNSELSRNSIMEGVYTHFSKADEVDKTHTKAQISKFHSVVRSLHRAGIHPPLVHSANSAGIIDSSLLYTDEELGSGFITAWRMGVSLYGFYPSEDVDKSAVPELRPVMTWKTQIVQTKHLGPGHTISYGGEFVTGRNGGDSTVIATLPLGYADGFRRRLGRNKAPQKPAFHVLIHGKKAPIVGRVCMDMIHVDVTHIPGVATGDEVVIIGTQNRATITAEQMATKLKTINYEISCLVGKRVPRLYKKNGKFFALKSIICDTNKNSL